MKPTDSFTFTVHHVPSDYEVEIHISGHINLHGLAEHIIDAVGFDFDHAFGFYDHPEHPSEDVERYTLFADLEDCGEDDPGVMDPLISEVFKPGKEMLFFFDYGDDWRFHLLCTGATASTAKRKVREIGPEKGTPPIQYDYGDGR